MKHLVFGKAQNSHIQFLRYFFVGGSAAVVDLLLYTVLLKYVGLSYFAAAFFGYMGGLSWNYVISLMWVFESRHGRIKEVLMIFGIALGGLFWTELILYLLVGRVGLDPILSKIISQGIVLFWNFSMRKFYVFD